jgi:four helix bundle protein
MEYQFSFEKLSVWQKSRQFTSEIYSLTKNFPAEEKFGLVGQLRRASLSICSNIAEGNSRKSVKDRANFFHIAYSSSMEVLCQLVIASDLGFVKNEELKVLRGLISEITNKLNALYRKQLNE